METKLIIDAPQVKYSELLENLQNFVYLFICLFVPYVCVLCSKEYNFNVNKLK